MPSPKYFLLGLNGCANAEGSHVRNISSPHPAVEDGRVIDMIDVNTNFIHYEPEIHSLFLLDGKHFNLVALKI